MAYGANSETKSVTDRAFRQASSFQLCRGRIDFRWYWVLHWPYSRYQVYTLITHDGVRKQVYHNMDLLQHRLPVPLPGVLEDKVLIGELGSVNGLAAGSVVVLTDGIQRKRMKWMSNFLPFNPSS